jgi:hypothetical protein
MNGSPFLPLIDSGKISEKMTHGNVATKNGSFAWAWTLVWFLALVMLSVIYATSKDGKKQSDKLYQSKRNGTSPCNATVQKIYLDHF